MNASLFPPVPEILPSGVRGALMFLFAVLFSLIAACGSQDSGDSASAAADYPRLRRDMVESQLRSRDIWDRKVLEAMGKVPRHEFVPQAVKHLAYEDHPLPIGLRQTISQPYIVALMTQLADPRKEAKALEIGTGSGYQAAVLAELVDQVYTIEIVPELARRSAALLKRLGYENVFARAGDGYLGWPEAAPFDVILVTAAAGRIPEPLQEQLAEGGRLVIPVGDPGRVQKLLLLTKEEGRTRRQDVLSVRFVPMTGKIRQ